MEKCDQAIAFPVKKKRIWKRCDSDNEVCRYFCSYSMMKIMIFKQMMLIFERNSKED